MRTEARSHSDGRDRPLTRTLLATEHARGGFWWTRIVSQRIGAVIALPACRRGVHPSTLTLASMGVGVVVAVVACALLAPSPVLAAAVAVIGWQLSYGFDCADGQVARATGTSSVAGARLDVTSDFVVRAAIAGTLAFGAREVLPTGWVAIAVLLYLFPLFDELSGRDGDAGTPAVDRGGLVYRLLGLVRDGGTQKLAAGLSLALGPAAVAAVLVSLAGWGAAQAVGRIVVLSRRSTRGATDHVGTP